MTAPTDHPPAIPPIPLRDLWDTHVLRARVTTAMLRPWPEEPRDPQPARVGGGE